MNEELKAKLARFLPIRMVVRLENGVIEGKVEHSFSMGWDPKLSNVFWSGKAFSMLGEHQLDGVKWANENANRFKFNEFVIDPLAEDSPIEVDWESWLTATDKFSKRNAKFTVQPHGVYMLRAMAAERELKELKPQFENVCKQRDEAEAKLEQLSSIINPPSDDAEDE